MKKRASPLPKRKETGKNTTGIRKGWDRFFVGGEYKIDGFTHIKPPRLTEEYMGMSVSDLVLRIEADIEEIVARVWPTYQEDFEAKFPRKRRFPIVPYTERLQSGVGVDIQDVAQLTKDEPKSAAGALAFIARWAAASLVALFVTRPLLIREVARKSNTWPVNLGTRVKKIKGKSVLEIAGLAFARKYITELELNLECRPRTAELSSVPSPFRLAAEALYFQLQTLKEEPHNVWFQRITPWATRLFALTAPMTKSNSQQWWEVARIYLYERWAKAQEEFKPLIKHLGFTYPIQLSARTPYLSNIKSRVIDNSLKDAFLALARADL